MNIDQLAIQIEALLFALGRPLSRAELSKMLEQDAGNINQAIAHLIEKGSNENRGIVLVDDGKMVELRANASATDIIERVRREEFSRELGRAGAEVIAII